MTEIWVSGSPSFVGGADTELFHQIILWRRHGIRVHIVPTCDPDPRIRAFVAGLGCRIEKYSSGIFKDKFVVSYCNGQALLNLLNDAKNRPRAFVWFNCMTWTTRQELDALRQGLITHLGFVSDYQKNLLLPNYAKALPEKCSAGKVRSGRNGFPEIIEYSPWLDICQFSIVKKPSDYFGVGRISRNDPAKFSTDCWRIFDRVLTPADKKVFILGYDKNVQKVTGPPPKGLDWQWWTPGAISSDKFFSKIDVLIHKTGNSRESYCRVFVEAMSHGVVPLAEDDFAFPEILRHSAKLKDYLLCTTSDEMSFKASQLAFFPDLLREMKTACRLYSERHFAPEGRAIRNWIKLFKQIDI
jgi:glycosyltransferase involved in cell wall biosynthesis